MDELIGSGRKSWSPLLNDGLPSMAGRGRADANNGVSWGDAASGGPTGAGPMGQGGWHVL
eukprot:scaffold142075_cov23-Prasinocladus_malaysianus.AAC.1